MAIATPQHFKYRVDYRFECYPRVLLLVRSSCGSEDLDEDPGQGNFIDRRKMIFAACILEPWFQRYNNVSCLCRFSQMYHQPHGPSTEPQ